MLPVVKWAGGKRQLLSEIRKRMPENYNRYFEPFLGGGAVLFDLQPENAFVNDNNPALVCLYRMIKLIPEELIKSLSELDAKPKTKETYYALRERYNEKLKAKTYDEETAALLVYLNKHCFNGLYRVNRQGLFNVPYNQSKIDSFDPDHVMQIHEYLKEHVHIFFGDFEAFCDRAMSGDFVFLDSPYAPLNPISFTAYTKEGFALEDHQRLARVFQDMTDRGVYCMLTNHNTPLIWELYKNYRFDVVPVMRSINSNAAHRVGEEVIVCNY